MSNEFPGNAFKVGFRQCLNLRECRAESCDVFWLKISPANRQSHHPGDSLETLNQLDDLCRRQASLETLSRLAAASRTVIKSGVVLPADSAHLARALVDLLDVGEGIVRQLPADALVVGQLAFLDSLQKQLLSDSVGLDDPAHAALVLADDCDRAEPPRQASHWRCLSLSPVFVAAPKAERTRAQPKGRKLT